MERPATQSPAVAPSRAIAGDRRVVARRELREPIGHRVARLRAKRGWTQQDVADRLAMSRTAVSHLEADMAQPSERTVLLLAGLFHLEPHVFVADTLYPLQKAERLPHVVARYTEVDLQLQVLAAELAVHEQLGRPMTADRIEGWRTRLGALLDSRYDHADRERIRVALDTLRDRMQG